MPDILREDDAFSSFYEAIHGYKPFKWQRRLEAVTRTGWRAQIDVPTSAGKTSVLDIAVFRLVCDAARAFAEGAPRTAALRIFFVVDRRIVVDDAYKHAEKIATALATAKDGILAAAAEPLRRLAGLGGAGATPLGLARLRGGAPKDPDWVRSPSQPTIILSTVDQVGSRLLFRGYGVSDRMKPIHAALVGSDAMIFLDEAHLSHPFLETLEAIRNDRDKGTTGHFPPFISLSATPRREKNSSSTSFRFDWKEDLEGGARDPGTLEARLHASKPTRLVSVEPGSEGAGESSDTLVRKFAETARGYVEEADPKVIAVVVNRVSRARAIFDALEKVFSDYSSIDVVLLIGRSRPLDRDALLVEYAPRMMAKRQSDGGIGTEAERHTRKLIVVATQCIEAGADLDFDAMVTEIAALDSLRQRFGRLNRMGRDIAARATIIASSESISAKAKPDPIYGEAIHQTWKLLSSVLSSNVVTRRKGGKKDDATVDFGVIPSRAWLPDNAEDCLTPIKHAPYIVPAFIRQWACTSPVPRVEPEPALFLHGPSSTADVQIVWRGDLEDDDDGGIEDRERCGELLEEWRARVAVCPPSSLEAISVPLHEARRWLGEGAYGDITDVEGAEESGMSRTVKRLALRWRGREDAKFVSFDERPRDDDRVFGQLAPGDIVVVPASRGGCDRWGWNPKFWRHDKVTDLGERANRLHRGREIVRLSGALFEAERRDELQKHGDAGAGVRARSERRSFEQYLPGQSGGAGSDSERDDIADSDFVEHLLSFANLPASWRERLGDHADSFRVVRDVEGRAIALERRLSREELDALRKRATDTGMSEIGGEPTAASTEDDEEGSRFDDRLIRKSEMKPRTSVLLSAHSAGVRDMARAMAHGAGLAGPQVEDIALAAFLHDAGKAHPEFQSLLFGGDEVAVAQARMHDRPLAKSARLTLDERPRGRITLPPGARHEVASLSFALAHPALQSATDGDLVLWLIGTHHGYGRPFFPSIEWPEAGSTFRAPLGENGQLIQSVPAMSLAALTARWGEMHRQLVAKYGPWELARYEAIVRLADHQRSKAEQDGSLS